MPKPSKNPAQQDDGLLLEPALKTLRKLMQQQADASETHTVPLEATPAGEGPVAAHDQLVLLSGAGAPSKGGGCQLPQSLLLVASGYYRHAASFGPPPLAVTLPCGDRCVRLLGAALSAGSAQLGPASVAELLQAASYLQVVAVLDACAAYLQRTMLEFHPSAVLRVALDLGLQVLAARIEADFLQDFYKLSGEKAAVLLREWPAAKRRELLGSCRLAAPTECCLVETLCHLAKAASSAEAVALLDCTHFHLMSAHELAAATLYLQHNSRWVDRRLSTALAWRLLGARVAADVAAWPAPAGVPGSPAGTLAIPADALTKAAGSRVPGQDPTGIDSCCIELDAGGAAHPRAMRRRCLLCALSTAHLAAWSGTTMFLASRRIPCSFDPPKGGRPLVLQLERGEPRHGPAEGVAGTTGRAGGDTDGGGTGWDVQVSRDPERFPAGFQAVCLAFGRDGLFWCQLGPLAKPGPTWWKVGFLASQLPKALPAAPLVAGAGADVAGTAGGLAGCVDEALLLVGWWVPQQ